MFTNKDIREDRSFVPLWVSDKQNKTMTRGLSYSKLVWDFSIEVWQSFERVDIDDRAWHGRNIDQTQFDPGSIHFKWILSKLKAAVVALVCVWLLRVQLRTSMPSTAHLILEGANTVKGINALPSTRYCLYTFASPLLFPHSSESFALNIGPWWILNCY